MKKYIILCEYRESYKDAGILNNQIYHTFEEACAALKAKTGKDRDEFGGEVIKGQYFGEDVTMRVVGLEYDEMGGNNNNIVDPGQFVFPYFGET